MIFGEAVEDDCVNRHAKGLQIGWDGCGGRTWGPVWRSEMRTAGAGLEGFLGLRPRLALPGLGQPHVRVRQGGTV